MENSLYYTIIRIPFSFICNFCLCMLCIDVFSNLEHLASGQLHLSAIITMFTDTNSVPSSTAATAGLIQVRTLLLSGLLFRVS